MDSNSIKHTPSTTRPKPTKTITFDLPRQEERALSGKDTVKKEKLIKKGDKFRFRKDQDIVNTIKRLETPYSESEIDFKEEQLMIKQIKETELGEENDEELEILFRKLIFQDLINALLFSVSAVLKQI